MSLICEKLKKYMSDLSEEACCAGWMEGLEYALWKAVIEGPQEYGRLSITNEHIQDLKDLSKACSGWIYFDDKTEESWIALDKWEMLYKNNKSRYFK